MCVCSEGFWKPAGGMFTISRPHATFSMSVSFNRRVDPFDELETVTMDEGDFLIVAVMKTGESVCLRNLSESCNIY